MAQAKPLHPINNTCRWACYETGKRARKGLCLYQMKSFMHCQYFLMSPFFFFSFDKIHYLLPLKDQEDIYFMKGAFEEVIRHCTMYNSSGISLMLTPQQKASYQQEEKRMGSSGLRGQSLLPVSLVVPQYLLAQFWLGWAEA